MCLSRTVTWAVLLKFNVLILMDIPDNYLYNLNRQKTNEQRKIVKAQINDVLKLSRESILRKCFDK